MCNWKWIRALFALGFCILNTQGTLILNENVSFTFNNYHHCGNSSSMFYSSSNTSLTSCLTQCGVRASCRAVNFRRALNNYCELLYNNDTSDREAGCLYIPREDIQFSGHLNQSCGCLEGEMCNVQNNTCSKTECQPLRSIEFGDVYGNRFSIGSKLFVTCHHGYLPLNDVSIITCLSGGGWDQTPVCIRDVTCPTGWIKYKESCTYDDGKMKFCEGEDYCDTMESHLARIDSSEEDTFLHEEIVRAVDYIGNVSYWIGMTQDTTTYEWRWTDGFPITYTNWAPGQPQNNTENCLFLYHVDVWNWHDVRCNLRNNVICRKAGTPVNNVVPST